MEHLRLERPLLVFDLETTGLDPESDRIVEIAVLKIEPAGSRESRRRLIDPERPIPAAASAIHGIRDEDVRGAPTFARIARSLLDFIGTSDLAGFNVARFDIPLLDREFRDCGLDLDVASRRVVDAMTIYKRKEPRDLSAAVRFFLGRDHTDAHTAEADVLATAEVLEAELGRYDDLPRTVPELDRWIRRIPANAVDRDGKFVRVDGEVTFNFGRYQGRALRDVVAEARDYLEWILESDFPEEARSLVRDALGGR